MRRNAPNEFHAHVKFFHWTSFWWWKTERERERERECVTSPICSVCRWCDSVNGSFKKLFLETGKIVYSISKSTSFRSRPRMAFNSDHLNRFDKLWICWMLTPLTLFVIKEINFSSVLKSCAAPTRNIPLIALLSIN